jgi:hypothetical protein
MHPIERLRYVARAEEDRPSLLVREAAGAIAGFSDDPAGMLTACRRLVDRHWALAPMWWLAARVLCSLNPYEEAWQAADELEADPTPRVLSGLLPDEGSVLVVGWPEVVGTALRRGGGLTPYVVDGGGQWGGAIHRIERSGVDLVEVPESGIGAAVDACSLVLLEASALGADGFVAPSGSRAAAAVGSTAGVPVWLAAGVGRVLPGRLWGALAGRFDADPEPWLADDELISLDLVDAVVGPKGTQSPADAVRRADCPIPPELLKGLP